MDHPLQTGIPIAAGPIPLSYLSGMQPMPPGAWLIRDAAFAGQMALRDR